MLASNSQSLRLGEKTGSEKRKKVYSIKMLNLDLMMMCARQTFSAFSPENTPKLRENQLIYIQLSSIQNPGNFSDGRQGDIVKLVGSTNVCLDTICDSFKQLGGSG
jgi:hypothetical protein